MAIGRITGNPEVNERIASRRWKSLIDDADQQWLGRPASEEGKRRCRTFETDARLGVDRD